MKVQSFHREGGGGYFHEIWKCSWPFDSSYRDTYFGYIESSKKIGAKLSFYSCNFCLRFSSETTNFQVKVDMTCLIDLIETNIFRMIKVPQVLAKLLKIILNFRLWFSLKTMNFQVKVDMTCLINLVEKNIFRLTEVSESSCKSSKFWKKYQENFFWRKSQFSVRVSFLWGGGWLNFMQKIEFKSNCNTLILKRKM